MGALITSIVAVIVAVVIPIIIAYKQNKIALFDKRFKSYDILNKYIGLANILKNNQCVDSCNDAVVVVFFNGESDSFRKNNAIIKLLEISTPLKYMPFLFKNISEDEVEYMIRSLGALASAILINEDVNKYKQLYINTVQKFSINHLDKIKIALRNHS